MNQKASLGVAIAIFILAVGYQIFLVANKVPLSERINGKWANPFISFEVNTKDKTITFLALEDYPIKKDYEITKKEDNKLTLNIEGDIYFVEFDENDLVYNEMTFTKEDGLPSKLQKMNKGDKDPTKRPALIDDPDEKLRKSNEERRNM
ncbi:MAG: hypothetical protein BWY78_00223 [Alphaproteobacteria bacterium ADurb.Bin438]|nr:MAG: hypothetical protein BWY78_00223 [Alphaproteobacteria bacterium ADurb.Bin438]